MIGVYDYTVILTYLSLLSGCTGTIIAMSGLGHPYIGMFLMLFAGLCDCFDGKVARTKKNRTQLELDFGVQIDSFADLISFGVLPAAIGMSLLRRSVKYYDMPLVDANHQLHWYPVVLILIALFYVLASMIRLAYFNATQEEREQEVRESGVSHYTGLPLAAAALVFPIVLMLHYIPCFDLSIVYFVVMLILAVLYLGRFKIRKPGIKGLSILIGIGLVEFIVFLILKRVTMQ